MTGVREKEGEKVVVLEILGEAVRVLDASGDLLEEEEEVTVPVGKMVREVVEKREVEGEMEPQLDSEGEWDGVRDKEVEPLWVMERLLVALAEPVGVEEEL